MRTDKSFSCTLTVDALSPGGRVFVLKATDEEIKDFTDRFGLLDLSDLSAKIEVKPRKKGGVIAVSGVVRAHIVQSCVITLEPVSQEVEEHFSCLFAPEEKAVDYDAFFSDEQFDPDAEPPEAIIDGQIELGAFAAENFALAIPPFPRKEGAVYEGEEEEVVIEEEKKSPFEKLKALK